MNTQKSAIYAEILGAKYENTHTVVSRIARPLFPVLFVSAGKGSGYLSIDFFVL